MIDIEQLMQLVAEAIEDDPDLDPELAEDLIQAVLMDLATDDEYSKSDNFTNFTSKGEDEQPQSGMSSALGRIFGK